MPEPQRPDGLPDEAEWDEDDQEWVLGDRDENGEFHGDVRYYRPDGTLCSIAAHTHGSLEGVARRFHPNGDVSQIAHYENNTLNGKREWFASEDPTPEAFYTPGMSRDIVRAEVEYVDGRTNGFAYFLADGTQVEADGSPVRRDRPGSVPRRSFWRPKLERWVDGDWDERGRRVGALRLWYEDGKPAVVEHYQDNIANGPAETFRRDGTLLSRSNYVDGELSGLIRYYHRSGTLARQVAVGDGRWLSDLVDFDESGTERGRSTPPELTELDAATPSGRETEWLDELGLSDDPEPSPPLSPAGLADIIAAGWGGIEERDPVRARHARAVAREHPDPVLQRALAETRLDVAPRLMTADRANRLIEALEDGDVVDVDRLRISLADEGGVGETVVLSSGGAAALAELRLRVSDHGLHLVGCALRTLPVELRHMFAVRTLDVSRNQLTELPDVVADMIQLRSLKAGNNRIESVTSRLGWLHELNTVYLNDNRLTCVPDSLLDCTELRVLNLSANQIGELPADFGRLRQLRQMWLGQNPLLTLPDSFADLSQLHFLHFTGVEWEEPPPVLWELRGLRTLWLVSHRLKRLPEGIARLENLEKLSIWYSGLESLPDSLHSMTHLKELRVRGNPIEDSELEALREALPDTTIL